MNPISYMIFAIILIVVALVSWVLALTYRKNIVEKRNVESAEKAREILDNAVKIRITVRNILVSRKSGRKHSSICVIL